MKSQNSNPAASPGVETKESGALLTIFPVCKASALLLEMDALVYQ